MEYKIIRQNSPFGNMKWQLVGYLLNGGKSRQWFKTQKEAIHFLEMAKYQENK